MPITDILDVLYSSDDSGASGSDQLSKSRSELRTICSVQRATLRARLDELSPARWMPQSVNLHAMGPAVRALMLAK